MYLVENGTERQLCVLEGGDQCVVHGFSSCAGCVLCEGKVVCNFLELGQFGSLNSKGVSKGCAWGLFGGNIV